MRRAKRTASFAVAVAFCLSNAPARADEGFWTFDKFPSVEVGAAYGFAPDAAFLDHVRKSTARIAGGCSSSFVSPHGLVMTNHHCAVGCVLQISDASHDFVTDGFTATRAEDERPCPGFELDRLDATEDVTARVEASTAGKTGQAAVDAAAAVSAEIQKGCGDDPAVRCDVVTLYGGGRYDLYRYHRYRDVRLAFAPEYAIAQFGGDPDNFNFPRFDLDVAFLRAYENGAPAVTPDYLAWSAHGAAAGAPAFTIGDPGPTERDRSVAELAYERRTELPAQIPLLAQLRGEITQFRERGAEQAREARTLLQGIENSYKRGIGRQQALEDPAVFDAKAAREAKLRAFSPDAVAALDELATLQATRARLEPRLGSANLPFGRSLLGTALRLVRAAAERARPNADRLPEYTDSALVGLVPQLESKAPVYADLETLNLSFAFTHLREDLGADDPFVRSALGAEAPSELAARLVTTTTLADPAVRAALYDGGAAAIAASADPMIRFAVRLDPALRAMRRAEEAAVVGPERVASERVAKARFAAFGTSVYPDASFSPRVSYGAVKGFPAVSGPVAPFTTVAGLYARATGAVPFALPQRWLGARAALDPSTPFDFTTTNDIVGGNSGSPVVDRDAHVVGLAFDGNIYSLGGYYGYDGARNRTIAVDSRILTVALRDVYRATRLASEIAAAAR